MSGKKGSGSWKVAYADFVTAMMAFFLLMWILNMVPPDSKKILSGYFQPETAGKGGSDGVNAQQVVDIYAESLSQEVRGNIRPENAVEQTQRYVIASKLKRVIMEDPQLLESSGITSDDSGVLLRVNSSALFRPGSAALTPEAKLVVQGVLAVLKEYNLNVLVRGHADESEPVGGIYPTVWELSGARSAAAASLLIAQSEGVILPTRVRAASFGATRPILPATTERNRAANSRVEFYFHRPDALNFGPGS